MGASHYTVIGHVADAISGSKAIQDLMVGEGQQLTVQIGDDLQNPVGEVDCPVVTIISLGADGMNGREPKTHRLEVNACFVAPDDSIDSEETEESDADENKWTVTRRTFGTITTADQIVDAIRDAVYSHLSALAKAGTCTLSLGMVARDIDSDSQYPLVTATATIEIDNPNPEMP